MRSTSAKTPDHYDDPLGLDNEVWVDELKPHFVPTPTGLSEDDATSWLALRFDPCARICRNCEAYCAVAIPDDGPACPVCGFYTLAPVGTKPAKRKLR